MAVPAACTRTVRRPTAASAAAGPGLRAEVDTDALSLRKKHDTAKLRV
jgi:hypothetical protein